MIKRTIEISNGPARLSIKNRQLVIDRPETEPATVPVEDIGVLIIDHPAVTYSHSVFTKLVETGAAVIFCGDNHHPSGIVMGFDAHNTQTERHRWQCEIGQIFKKKAWAQIIKSKIQQQAAVLKHTTGEDHGLIPMSRRVKSGDPDNLEAQAAQRYWKILFGHDFRRNSDLADLNAGLNYGYAILRACMARAIAGSGLIPTLGLFHKHRNNAFCLADDLMEPYRPFIDLRLWQMIQDGTIDQDTPIIIDRPLKAGLLSVFNETIAIGNRHTPIGLAIHQTSASLARGYESGTPQIDLPSSLFLRQDEFSFS